MSDDQSQYFRQRVRRGPRPLDPNLPKEFSDFIGIWPRFWEAYGVTSNAAIVHTLNSFLNNIQRPQPVTINIESVLTLMRELRKGRVPSKTFLRHIHQEEQKIIEFLDERIQEAYLPPVDSGIKNEFTSALQNLLELREPAKSRPQTRPTMNSDHPAKSFFDAWSTLCTTHELTNRAVAAMLRPYDPQITEKKLKTDLNILARTGVIPQCFQTMYNQRLTRNDPQIQSITPLSSNDEFETALSESAAQNRLPESGKAARESAMDNFKKALEALIGRKRFSQI